MSKVKCRRNDRSLNVEGNPPFGPWFSSFFRHLIFDIRHFPFPRSLAMTTASPHAKTRTRRPWQPDQTAHLIFQWVKMEGQKQGWVAAQFGIDQATVSRIVQRYERWQAHAQERDGGRLDRSERLRAQRWLTFERNELILASCLRIAGEMEGFT